MLYLHIQKDTNKHYAKDKKGKKVESNLSGLFGTSECILKFIIRVLDLIPIWYCRFRTAYKVYILLQILWRDEEFAVTKPSPSESYVASDFTKASYKNQTLRNSLPPTFLATITSVDISAVFVGEWSVVLVSNTPVATHDSVTWPWIFFLVAFWVKAFL